MLVPIPQSMALKISQDAVRYAREEMHGYGWSDKALQALQPFPGEGMVGIRTSLKYLMYQERGTKPFLMHWVQGRTIPMRGPGGVHFRRGGHVGEPGYVDIPGRGKVWRNQRWLNPGVKDRRFMERGLQRAIEENRPMLQALVKQMLWGKQ